MIIFTVNKNNLYRRNFMNDIRHKCFISYHHYDQDEVEDFVNKFDEEKDIFISRSLGVDMEDDIIQSDSTSYVMGQIRKLYLIDSTVTIVMIGKCTWARRYVDWEIKTSLRQGDNYTPNGLIGILLPSMKNTATAPERLSENLLGEKYNEGYARWYTYPSRKDSLKNYIEDAFQARTDSYRTSLIVNSAEMFKNNRTCP